MVLQNYKIERNIESSIDYTCAIITKLLMLMDYYYWLIFSNHHIALMS